MIFENQTKIVVETFLNNLSAKLKDSVSLDVNSLAPQIVAAFQKEASQKLQANFESVLQTHLSIPDNIPISMHRADFNVAAAQQTLTELKETYEQQKKAFLDVSLSFVLPLSQLSDLQNKYILAGLQTELSAFHEAEKIHDAEQLVSQKTLGAASSAKVEEIKKLVNQL